MLDDRVTSVRYRNFTSFADEEARLGDLVVLVGPNGSGKSNFIEGLRFLRDALRLGLDAAITNRGGIGQVRRRVPHGGRPPDVEVGIKAIVSGSRFSYDVLIGALGGGEWTLKRETCVVEPSEGISSEFQRESEVIRFSGPSAGESMFENTDFRQRIGPVFGDSNTLLLTLIGEPFDVLARFLTGLGAYSIYPDVLRTPQRQLPSGKLDDDAQNLASVLKNLRVRRTPAADRIRDVLDDLIPGVTNFRVRQSGGYLAVSLAFQRAGREMWFDASQLSDGTLRLLGILTAIHQTPAPSLIAIEEPELTVHPGAAAVLTDELVEASERTQILVTTHSPDIVARMPIETLRVVEMTTKGTRVGKVSETQIDAVNQQLFSPGDLIRIQGLRRELKATG